MRPLFALMTISVAACGGGTASSARTGSVTLSVSGLGGNGAANALVTPPPSAPVASVAITVTGPSYPAPGVTNTFTSGFDSISEDFDALRVGSYTFSGVAKDAEEHVLFEGSTSYDVIAGAHGAVLLTLHQVTAAGTVANGSPTIDGVSTTTGAAGPTTGTPIHLTASVTTYSSSPTFAWSSSCQGVIQHPLPGAATIADVFADPASLETDFTSYCLGDELLTFSVTETTPESGTLTSVAQVTLTYAAQGGVLTVAFDRYPDIMAIGIAAPGVIPTTGDTVTLTATVDDHGSAVSYAWSDDCGGSFTDEDTLSPTWTAPSTAGTCTITLDVQETAYTAPVGHNSGTLALAIGPGQL